MIDIPAGGVRRLCRGVALFAGEEWIPLVAAQWRKRSLQPDRSIRIILIAFGAGRPGTVPNASADLRAASACQSDGTTPGSTRR